MKPNTDVIMDEPAVRELLQLMAVHNAPGQADMLEMLQQIAGMEKQLHAAIVELAAMRRELAEARENPIKRSLQKLVKALEQNISALQERLGGLKRAIVEGCKKTLAAFRAQGVSALAHTAEFFHIRPALEAVGRELDKAIAHDDKALTAIAAMGREYHEAGRHLKNMFRAASGREPVVESKSPGALAHAVEVPFQRERRLFVSMKSRTEGAVKQLERLEEAARPPIRKTMDELNAKIAAARQTQEKTVVKVKRAER